MRKFALSSNMFHLTDEEVEQLEAQAATGDPEACYKWGRYLYCVRPDHDSVSKAAVQFMMAKAEGVVDAAVAISLMWYNGDFGMVDRTKGKQFLLEALEKENEFAAFVYLRKLIYGHHGFEVDTDKALTMLKALTEKSDNPNFYYLLGVVYQIQSNYAESLPWLEKAYAEGVGESAMDLALARSGGFTADGNFADYDVYLKELDQLSAESQDGFATYLYAALFASDYDKLEDEAQKAEAHEAIKAEVENALAWGCGEAALFLGDAYYDATCGFEEDLARAFSYYAKGAILGSADCYERMYEMVVAEEIEGNYSQDFADNCVLEAARLGSQDMMRQVVAIYKAGRLTDFAAEIEQYYLPEVEAMDDDDMPDDDGRYDAYA